MSVLTRQRNISIWLILFALFAVQVQQNSQAQTSLKNHTRNWTFSADSVGLNFLPCSPPTPFTKVLFGGECMGVMSDINANLIAYSNGLQVYDRTHQLMPNGDSILGHQSSTQGQIMIPNPSDTNRYYLFTVDALENSGNNGLRYSEIDKTLNGGLGDVISSTKNTLLFAPCLEALSAVANQSNDGYWLIAANYLLNQWHLYSIDQSGVSLNQTIPFNFGNYLFPNAIKFSTDGSMFAVSLSDSSSTNPQHKLSMYGFDHSTGALSHRWFSNAGIDRPSYCEFSQDNSKLYHVEWNLPFPLVFTSNIYQYNLSAGSGSGIGPDTIAIKNSKTSIYTGGLLLDVVSTLQLGPDCKVYFSTLSSQNLHAIAQPNLSGGACNVILDYIDLSQYTSDAPLALPNLVTSFLKTPCTTHFVFENLCSGQATDFYLISDCNAVDSVQWDFGDLASGSNTSAALNPQHMFSSSGTYTISTTIYSGGTSFSYQEHITIIDCQPFVNFVSSDTFLCQGSCIDFTDLSISADTITSWFWDFGNGLFSNQQHPSNICYTSPGSYSVSLTISDIFGNSDTTYSLYIKVDSCVAPTAHFDIPDTLCIGDCIDFIDLSNGPPETWEWTFDGASIFSSTHQNPTNVCYNNAGLFEVVLKVSNGLGTDSISLFVYVLPPAFIDAGPDIDIGIGNGDIILANAGSGNYQWSPSLGLSCSTCLSPTASPTETTLYQMVYTDQYGCMAQDDVLVTVNNTFVLAVPSGFSPNGDGNNDVLLVHSIGVESIWFKVFNRYGQKLFETRDLNTGWDGTYDGVKLNPGVYTYVVEYNLFDGAAHKQYGQVTLIK